MERISTGLSELDAKLEGGYPEGKAILVTGASGTGKTIFGLHFLWRSCIDGRKCVHIATEESPEDLLVQAEMLELDLRPYLDSEQLVVKRVFDVRTQNVEQAAEFGGGSGVTDVDILKQVKRVPDDTDVVVIDNMGVFALDLSVKEFRDRIDTMNRILTGKGCTTLFIMDEAAYKLTHEVSEYSAYGSIKLMVKENPYTGVRERYLDIPKMRSTEISLDLAVFDITSEGIKFRKSGSKA